jgi:LysM repeat protein
MAQPKTYTIEQGDSLSLISKKLYGDFSQTKTICEMNQIADCDKILPGQKIIVPDVPEKNTSDAQVISTSSFSSSNIKTQIGKWFPWILVLGAAVLLTHEARKERKKSAAPAKKPAAAPAKKLSGVKRKLSKDVEAENNRVKDNIRENIRRLEITVKQKHWPAGYIENEKRALAAYKKLLNDRTLNGGDGGSQTKEEKIEFWKKQFSPRTKKWRAGAMRDLKSGKLDNFITDKSERIEALKRLK